MDFKALKSTAKLVLKERQIVNSDSFEEAGCLLYQRSAHKSIAHLVVYASVEN